MLISPIRCQVKLLNNGVLSNIVAGLGAQIRSKTTRTGQPCKEVSQTEGRTVEDWPKIPENEPPAAWRCQCPQDPAPPNYDPYKIKVPNVVVPPMPPSNAKPMLDCKKMRGPCVPPPLPGPPCPPPPRKPFPWIYVWPVALFFTTMGIFYRFYLWKEERERLADNKPVWRPRRPSKVPHDATDLPPCVQYLIVGVGAAGWAAYRAIMEHDKSAKVFFITKEDILPYIRPPLSKHMWWNQTPPEVKNLHYVEDGKRESMYYVTCDHYMDPIKFNKKKSGPAVSIATGWCVKRVDPEEHRVWVKTLCGDRPIYYERCLLAPGSKAKEISLFKSAPKAVRDRVCTLRTVRDLEIAFRKVRAAKRVVVIGGGCIGTELAWHLGHMNQVIERAEGEEPIEIVHLIKDRGILSGIVPEYLGEWGVEKIRCEGVTVMPKTQVYDAFESPDGRLELTLSDGSTLVTDYVITCVGAAPREEMGPPSLLELDDINGGFVVNAELEARTHLWVAGDAASYYHPMKDARYRMEHFMNAVEMGAAAGANMAGLCLPAHIEPHFRLHLGRELEVEVVGEVGACMPTVALFKQCSDEKVAKTVHSSAGDGDRPCYKKADEYKNRYKRGLVFYLREETVVGMVFWNIPPIEDRASVVAEMLLAQPSYKDINLLAELLGFPETACHVDEAAAAVDPGPCITAWREF